METIPKSVLLLGATGLVGSECLKLLANDPSFKRVVVLTRGLLPHTPTERFEYHQIDFDVPSTFQSHINVDVVICALGTTIKKAGSQAAFRKVDYSYPILFAERALKAGAKHFLLVSSSGANADSRIFYTRVKGELEIELQKLGYPALSIFRPSLLLGHRAEFRLGEIVSKVILSPISFLIPKSVRPIQAKQVAASMVRSARADLAGVKIVRNQDMLVIDK
jgi:uncharacterized protein YbjT (DUF2867 family)